MAIEWLRLGETEELVLCECVHSVYITIDDGAKKFYSYPF